MRWELFFERLHTAENILTNVWAQHPDEPRVPQLMLQLIKGLSHERPIIKSWFQRAMALDPNNYEACQSKLDYLQPKWHGSREDMLEFGRTCVASETWGG